MTTELIRRIADHYGVQTAGNLHVGFKWIGAEIDARGPERVRLRRGGVVRVPGRRRTSATRTPRWPRCLTAELAARLKAEGKTLSQRLDELFRQYGCFTEGQINVQMPGEKGMDDMRALMARLRADAARAPRRPQGGAGPRLSQRPAKDVGNTVPGPRLRGHRAAWTPPTATW